MSNGQPQQINLDIGKYMAWKKSGSAQLQKVGKSSVFLLKDRFDEDTGNPIDPFFVPVSIGKIDEMLKATNDSISSQQETVRALEELRADVLGLLE